MEYVIETRSLVKKFGDVIALDKLNLQVPKGSIFAFLGPNGAGKTTTIDSLLGLTVPDDGEALVLAKHSDDLTSEDFAKIGFVSEDQDLPQWMTLQQLLEYTRELYPTWNDDFCEYLRTQMSLSLEDKIGSLARNQQVKVSLLLALAFKPELLILDEPFNALDPTEREEFIQGVIYLSEREHWSVFFTSHDIEEVDRLADWVGIMSHGKLHYSKKIGEMYDCFRLVNAELRNMSYVLKASQIPKGWLLYEQMDTKVRFIDCEYQAPKLEYDLELYLKNVEKYEVKEMSLKEIFLTLAKTYRMQE